ncbi:MAG: DUF255 domain-containing protein [Halobacteriaceae archaeon]
MHDADRTRVEWRPWGEDAFAAADRSGKPVLLSLVAPWCEWCRRMDDRVFDDPRIAANVNDGFVPVRVDADRNPMVRERYTMGGFPSTVFLTPDGEVISGATFLDDEGFRGILDRVREAWDARGAEAGRIPRAVRERGTRPGDPAEVERHVAGQVESQYDDENAGWGTDAKFPLPRTIEFALTRERTAARNTLAAIQRSLRDPYDGGFYRYAGERDWSEPQREKLLDTNAALCRAFANAYLVTGEDRYRETAAETVDYLTTTLWTGDAFGGSQEPGDYFSKPPSDRASAEEPPIDETAFADRNALAADALLTHHAYTDADIAGRYAERALDFLADELVSEGVVAHYDDPEAPRGLLADHAHVAGAFARAAQVLDPSYLDTARAVADSAIETLRGEDDGFVDGPTGDAGLCDRPLHPLDDNAHLANALVDLHALTGDARYGKVARAAVAAFAGAAPRMGPQVAAYATAASRVSRTPLRIAVATDPGTDLHLAALRMADHEKVVVPNAGGDCLPESSFERGAAYVLRGEETSRPACTPDELLARVADVA